MCFFVVFEVHVPVSPTLTYMHARNVSISNGLYKEMEMNIVRPKSVFFVSNKVNQYINSLPLVT